MLGLHSVRGCAGRHDILSNRGMAEGAGPSDASARMACCIPGLVAGKVFAIDYPGVRPLQLQAQDRDAQMHFIQANTCNASPDMMQEGTLRSCLQSQRSTVR